MSFRRKLSLLIMGSLLVFAGLCAMQYQLLRNTYRLEKDAWQADLSRALSKRAQSLTDTLNHRGMQLLIQTVTRRLEQEQRPDVRALQRLMDDRLKTERQAIRQVLARDSLLKSAAYALRYDRVILFGGQVPDTLLAVDQEPLWLAGKRERKDRAFLPVGQSQQRSGFTVKAVTGQPVFYQLAVSTSAFVYSPDRQRPVYRRMALTLAGSAVLILSVLTLFIAAFGAILRQKRIADITTDFANNMTHELKTPLSAAGLAVKSLRTPEAAKDTRWSADLLDQLEKQLDRIRRLMDSVLDSALAHPSQQPRLQVVRLVPIFDELRNLAAESGRSLLIDIDQVTWRTDPDLLTGILANLLDNAIKYTSGGIFLSAKVSGGELQIALADEGPAIPKPYRPYLFDKFFRVPQPLGHQVKGLGLGLYLCRQQATQLGAELLYWEVPGAGNKFVLILKADGDTHTDR